MLLALLAVFAADAYFDARYKRIPDIITAFGWFLLVLEAYIFSEPEFILVAGVSFALLFFVNSIAAWLGEPVIAWGDVILIPVYVAYALFMENIAGEFIFFLLVPWAALLFYVVVTGNNRQVPLAPFLFFGALVTLAV